MLNIPCLTSDSTKTIRLRARDFHAVIVDEGDRSPLNIYNLRVMLIVCANFDHIALYRLGGTKEFVNTLCCNHPGSESHESDSTTYEVFQFIVFWYEAMPNE